MDIQGGSACSQIPLRLTWAIMIHKAQELTLDKVVIDIGKEEFSAGLTFVACSRVRCLSDIIFGPHLLTSLLQAFLRACS